MTINPRKFEKISYSEPTGLVGLFAGLLDTLETDVDLGEELRQERAFGRTKNGGFPVLWDENRPGHLETCEHACLTLHCPTCGDNVNRESLSIYCVTHKTRES